MKRTVGLLLPSLGILLLLITLAACAKPGKNARGFVYRPTDYEKLGLSPGRIEPWEDGLRTSGVKGSYEWWYFDAALEDGSTVVIVFYTKSILEVNTGIRPVITFTLNKPDVSKALTRVIKAEAGEFSAAKDRCDVRIGANTFRGDLKDYAIHLDSPDIKADIKLHGTVPSWRPGTGHPFFIDAKGREHFFAWFSAVPRGTVEGSLMINGERKTVRGSGYHDHNWGDVLVLELIHDWYWGRAEVGPYTVIASYLTAADSYQNTTSTSFFLAKDGAIISQDSILAHCMLKDVYTDKKTGKPVANSIVYDYRAGKIHYRVTFKKEKDVEKTNLVDLIPGIKYVLAKLAGFDGSYLRFRGTVTIERLEEDKVVERNSENSAVWELMYLGHAPKEK